MVTPSANDDLMELLRQPIQRTNSDFADGTESAGACPDAFPPTVVEPSGSLSRRRHRRRSRLTPEVMLTEREWTGSPATTVSTTPSPLQFNCSPLMSSTPEPTAIQQRTTARRLLPPQPETVLDADSSSPATVMRRPSSSTFADSRYFVPIHDSGPIAGSHHNYQNWQQQFERRTKSSLSTRRLPAIVDAVLSPNDVTNAAAVRNGFSTTRTETPECSKQDPCSRSDELAGSQTTDSVERPSVVLSRSRSAIPNMQTASLDDSETVNNRQLKQGTNSGSVSARCSEKQVDRPMTSSVAQDVTSSANNQSQDKLDSNGNDISKSAAEKLTSDGPVVDATASKGEPEVNNFSSSTAMARVQVMKNRLRRLSLLYQNKVGDDEESPVVTSSQQSATHSISGDGRMSPMSSAVGLVDDVTQGDTELVSDSTTAVRVASEDNDSTSSGGRDEGFESEAVADSSIILMSSHPSRDTTSKGDVDRCILPSDGVLCSSVAAHNGGDVTSELSLVSGDNVPFQDCKRSHDLRQLIDDSQCASVGRSAALGTKAATQKAPVNGVAGVKSRPTSTRSELHTKTVSSVTRSRPPPSKAPIPSFSRRTSCPTPSSPRPSIVPGPGAAVPSRKLLVKTTTPLVEDHTFSRGTSTRSTMPLPMHRRSNSSAASDHFSKHDSSASTTASTSTSLPQAGRSVSAVDKSQKNDPDRTHASLTNKQEATRCSSAVFGMSSSSRMTASRGGCVPSSSHVDRRVSRPQNSTTTNSVRVFSTPVRYVPVVTSHHSSVRPPSAATAVASLTSATKSSVKSTTMSKEQSVLSSDEPFQTSPARSASSKSVTTSVSSGVDSSTSDDHVTKKSSVFTRLSDRSQSQYRKQLSNRKQQSSVP